MPLGLLLAGEADCYENSALKEIVGASPWIKQAHRSEPC